MIVLTKLPLSMNLVINTIYTLNDVSKVKIAMVCHSIIIFWEQCVTCRGPNGATMNKILAMHHKGPNPFFPS